MPTILETLQRGVALQNAGQFDDAEKHYEAVLQADPRQPDALHLLGLIAMSRDDHARAIKLINSAISILPTNPVFFSNLGVTLRRAERIDEAIEAYRRSIDLNPKSADAHFNLAKSLKLKGDREGARSAFKLATQLNPKKVSAWIGLMNSYADAGNYQSALRIGQEGLSLNPNSAKIHMNIGAVHKRGGRPDQTLASYRQAVAADPNSVEALCKLASNLIAKHEIQEGRELLKRAQEINASSEHAHAASGLLFKTVGDLDRAIKCYEQAIAVRPDFSTAYANLAVVQKQRGLLTEALANVDRALELQEEGNDSLVNRGSILLCLGGFVEAETSFRTALAAQDGFVDAHDNLLMCLQYHPDVDIGQLFEEHREWNRCHASGLAQPIGPEHSADPERVIRIAFTSADLGNHPVGYFSHHLLKHLSREQFHVSVYSDRFGDDPLGKELRELADYWDDVAPLSHESLWKKIRADQIDILVDLSGHTAHHRLLTFARRAAPIQMSWAGYVGTTGLAEMDYLVADRFHVPTELEEFYSERILRMPNGYICYSPPEYAPEPGPLPADRNAFVTFAVIANPAKVNAQTLAVWGRILDRVAGSKLLFCYTGWPDTTNQKRVLDAFARFPPERIIFDFKHGHDNMLRFYREIDIALDTFPYSGGLTACEALWMGVPTVTTPKDKFCSRHSFSHLSNVGLFDLIADSEEEYMEKAVALASDLESLARLRSELRSRVAASPLCDGRQFADDFSARMRAVWTDWCQSHC